MTPNKVESCHSFSPSRWPLCSLRPVPLLDGAWCPLPCPLCSPGSLPPRGARSGTAHTVQPPARVFPGNFVTGPSRGPGPCSAPGAACLCFLFTSEEAGPQALRPALWSRSGPGPPQQRLSAHQPDRPEGSAVHQLSSFLIPVSECVFLDGSGQIWGLESSLQGSASYFTLFSKLGHTSLLSNNK